MANTNSFRKIWENTIHHYEDILAQNPGILGREGFRLPLHRQWAERHPHGCQNPETCRDCLFQDDRHYEKWTADILEDIEALENFINNQNQ